MKRAAAEARHGMLAIFGHELRAPLARILHLSQETDATSGAAIAACARQQLELIDDLLDYTRGQVRPAELVVAPTYLHALMRQIADDATALAQAAGCALVMRIGAQVPPLAVLDARRLRQILRKLLVRAAHRAVVGGSVGGDAATAPARIVLALDALPLDDLSAAAASPPAVPNALLRFSVSLAGGTAFGLSDWLPFGDDARAPAGDENRADALGLALAGQLARGMDTTLQTTDGADGPAIFFTLQTSAADEAEAMLPHGAFDALPPMTGGRVLLLEAQPAMLDYLVEMLDGAGCDTTHAADVDTALALQRDQPVDLIVSSHQPPEIDAWTLLRRLREAGDGVPVVLHALTPPQRPSDCPPDGDFDAVLYRPTPALALLRLVRAALEK